MGRLMLVLAGCLVLSQIVLSFVEVILIIVADPTFQGYLADQTSAGASLTEIASAPATMQLLTQRILAYAIWTSILADVVTLALFLIIRGKRLVTTDITATVPVGGRWPRLGTAFVFILAIQTVVALINTLISLTGYDPSSVQSTLLGDTISTPAGSLMIVLVVPFLEEWIFRGAILRHLAPYGVNFAVVTQAVLFGLWHGNLYQGVFACAVGLVLGYVAVRFSLKWSYALHAASNGFALLMGASWMPEQANWIILSLALVGAAVILVLHRRQVRPFLAEGAPRVEHPFRNGWKHPAFIVVTAVLFLFSCYEMTALGS